MVWGGHLRAATNNSNRLDRHLVVEAESCVAKWLDESPDQSTSVKGFEFSDLVRSEPIKIFGSIDEEDLEQNQVHSEVDDQIQSGLGCAVEWGMKRGDGSFRVPL